MRGENGMEEQNEKITDRLGAASGRGGANQGRPGRGTGGEDDVQQSGGGDAEDRAPHPCRYTH